MFFGWRSQSPETSCDKQQTRGWCLFRDSKTFPFCFAPNLPTQIPIARGRQSLKFGDERTPLKAGRGAKMETSTGKEADPMAYQPTTTDVEFKALRGALSVLRSKLPRKERACLGVSKSGSTPRKRSRYSGLASRLEKALKKG